MNLYTLQKEINEKKIYIKLLQSKIDFTRQKGEPSAINLTEIKVQSTPRRLDLIDVAKIRKYEKQISEIESELKLYEPIVEDLEYLLKRENDRDQLIYFYVKFKGYTCTKAGYSVSPQIGERQVRRIVKKIEENLSNVRKCHLSSAIIDKME